MANIMIVDDDEQTIQLVEHTLNSAGHTTCVAKNGQEALELVTEEKPDLILMDLYMPDIDGVEVITNLQESKLTMNIPIIVISGATKELEFMQTSLLGPVSYIEKPFSPKDLVYRVKTILNKTPPASDHRP